MIQLKDVLHLYLGCRVLVTDIDGQVFEDKVESVIDDKGGRRFSIYEFGDVPFDNHGEYYQSIKPLLRPLSSMTNEQMKEYWIALSSEVEEKITADEIDVDMFYNDGGTMVDGDIEVGANITCRCFIGQIAIRKCGSAFLFNEAGELERLAGVPEGFLYLLKQRFDLFNLIPSGQAIDSTTSKTTQPK